MGLAGQAQTTSDGELIAKIGGLWLEEEFKLEAPKSSAAAAT